METSASLRQPRLRLKRSRTAIAATLAVCLASALLRPDTVHALDPDTRLTQYKHTSWRTQDGSVPAGMLSVVQDRPAESKQVLASAIDQAAAAIAEGRDAVQGLRNSATETNDLVDSLRALVEDLANENGNATSLHIEVQGTPRALHPIVRDKVFRIAGEALRNAFRHAGAMPIEVELRYDQRRLRVRVRDDGNGIDPDVLRSDGREGRFGLRGMRERAKLAGGKLTVWSGLDAGTEVELSHPAPHAYSSDPPAQSPLFKQVFGESETSDS